jgi:hypothetical protein
MAAKGPKNEGFNELGQAGDAGEPNADAVAAVLAAQSPTKELIGSIPEDPAADEAARIIELIKSSPDLAAAVVEAAATTRKGREVLKIPAGQGTPTGHYHRNFAREEHLHVTGGLEVAHPIDPETGYTVRPLPPGYITRYIATDGTTTDYKDESELPPDSTRPVAARDPAGGPLLTDAYKRWIDLLQEGQRLDNNVRSDLQVHGELQEEAA